MRPFRLTESHPFPILQRQGSGAPLAGAVVAASLALAFMLASKGPEAALVAAVAGFGFLATLRSRALACLAYLLLFFLGPVINPRFGLLMGTTAAKAFGALLLVHFGWLWVRSQTSTKNNYFVLLLPLAYGISLARTEGLTWTYYYQLLVIGVLTYLTFRYLLHEVRDLERFLELLPLLLVGLVAVQLLFAPPASWEVGVTVLAGMGSASSVSHLAALAVPLCFYFILTGRKPVRTFYLGSALFLLLVALFMTQRGGIVGLACGLAYMVTALGRGRMLRTLAVLALLAGVAWALLPEGVESHLYARFTHQSPGTVWGDQQRIYFLQRSGAAFLRNPLVGGGPGVVFTLTPHNFLVGVLLDAGLVGATLFTLAMATAWRQLREARARFVARGHDHLASWVIFLKASFLTWIVSSVFVHNAFDKLWYFYFGLAAAMWYVAVRPSASEKKQEC
ncbi:MAG: O-antigen ligase family protein [Gemmatimonadota bacterium]